MFNGTLKIRFFIDISWRYLITLIGLINTGNLLIFKFRDSKKLECSQISKFEWYEARGLKKSLGRPNLFKSFKILKIKIL